MGGCSAILTCDSDNAGVDRAPESELTGMSDEAQPSGQQAEQGLSSEEELDEDAEPQPAAPPPPPAPAAEPQPGPAAQQLGTPLVHSKC